MDWQKVVQLTMPTEASTPSACVPADSPENPVAGSVQHGTVQGTSSGELDFAVTKE